MWDDLGSEADVGSEDDLGSEDEDDGIPTGWRLL